MSSSPPPTHSTGVGAAADSPAPQSPAIPGAESSPSTPDVRADEGSGEGGADLPMTMQASVILTSLPKDAKSALEGAGEVGVEKVKIRFRAVGSAPGLTQPVRKLSSTARFESVVRFLRKQLRVQDHESVFCYVNSVFAPGLDEGIGNLWRCFKTKDELVVAYSITPAFG
ncbi:hypothetical protein BFW01_g3628 [Lasiodiplodia theobromae]|uniref:Ubiquitin-like protein ATG12 n=1 Tax=Lasiodiplodia theobromae TaxID=45133 RepID=A0A5N5D8D6_9PEZI|nr:Autophagy-like protein 12 [Lasiodiplodia theobromae]KAB2573907.1 Ubiquitin-like protein ATG12 [Lasiodiplodia theobromae]KAF4541271.1 Autophagy-like protein 12 [Lasiodiplodia theobromae]KAF9632765.1 hypothetical protein BFW01_g3628 [Lasiodiplodia theobromae]